jgi:hypothetical protein
MRKITALILGLLVSISPFPIQKGIAETFSNSDLLITEILPNPKGADKGREWIEFYNTSKQNISLSNWKLDNGKVFPIPDGIIIPPKSYFVLENENLKMTLKNTNATLSFLDPSDKVVEEISYAKALDDQSYSLITIKTSKSTKNAWEWTSPTKNSANPIFYTFSGKILTPPQTGKDFSFEIEFQNKPLKITFSEITFSPDLLQTLFQKDTTLNLFVEKSNDTYLLKDFQILNSPPSPAPTPKPTSPHWELYLLIPIGILLLTLTNLWLSRRDKSLPQNPHESEHSLD